MTQDIAQGPGSTTTNTAHIVGVQGQTIHRAEVNQYFTGETPQAVFESGVRYLANGATTVARRRIDEALHSGHDNPSVRLHWILAMVSKRQIRDLSPEERTTLASTSRRFSDWSSARISQVRPVPASASDRHLHALAVVSELVACLLDKVPDTDRVAGIEKRILDLPENERVLISQHLGEVLQAATKEALWNEAVAHARADQKAHDRTARAWLYFEPEPTRVWILAEPDPRTEGRWIRPVMHMVPATALGAVALVWLGGITVATLIPGAILAFLVALLSAGLLARHAFDWCYHSERRRTEDHVRGRGPMPRDGETRQQATKAPDGFAAQVTHYFEYYFGKYRPDEFRGPGGWQAWLTETERIRRHLDKEVERTYRSSGVRAENIAWLIRYLASDVAERHRTDNLDDYQDRHAVGRSTKISAVLFGLLTLGALIVVAAAAAQAAWFTSALCLVSIVVAARYAVPQWYAFAYEVRAFQDHRADTAQERDRREAAYDRWTKKLSRRPGEDEMTTWFACDTTLLLDEAIRAFGLRPGDVDSHVFLSAKMPTGQQYRVKSARDEFGPWRYSHYELSIFLVLRDGLHSYTRRWRFEKAELVGDAKRFHFRLETIESGSSPHDRSVRLRLIGGTTKEFTMSDDGTVEPEGHRQPDFDRQADDELPSTSGPDASVYRDASGLIELRRTFERVSRGLNTR